MSVYKIQIAPSLYQQLGLSNLTYLKQDDAIDGLEKALKKAGITYTITKEADDVVFHNSVGGQLAKIFQKRETRRTSG